MYKRLIVLILCLPLVLMISLFSISQTVSIGINVPVSKIQILGESVVYLDLDKQEKYFVDYTVYPTNAQNKKVSFVEPEQVGSSPLAELEYVDGYIVPKSCGKAKVYLETVDGGFRDSFIVQVDSNALQEIACSIENPSIYVGDSTKILTQFIPEDTKHTLLNYQVENENICEVSPLGTITGKRRGTTSITIISVQYPNITATVSIEVKNKDIIDFAQPEITTWEKYGAVEISLDTTEECTFAYSVYDEHNNSLDSSVIAVELNQEGIQDNGFKLNYAIANQNFIGDIYIQVSATTASGLVVTKSCKITCTNQVSAKFENENISKVAIGGKIFEPFRTTPSNANVDIEVSSSDHISVELTNKITTITANKLGVATLTIKIINKENPTEFVTISKEIVVTTPNLMITESTKTYGIENEFAFAKTEVNGNTSSLELSLTGATFGSGFTKNITYVSSSTNAQISKSGLITLSGATGNELVDFKAVFNYKGITFESAPFTINCIYDGVNVRNYLDLHTETTKANPRPIVMQADIKEDFAVGVTNYYKEIVSTYDTTYYQNINDLDKAKIKILIEFRNNVYGNGYTINAHNVAWSKNLLNAGPNAVFNGPRDFVATSKNGGLLSVKAQDNVCFAVYEGVTISNIILKNCDLEADPETKQIDLTDLTYTGTTVEVLGDNVTIQYSRLLNGRNVVRAFGDIEDSTKQIHLNIKNSILSNAREFIMRLGSNCFVDGTNENPSPLLPNDSSNSFPKAKAYKDMAETEKANYDNNFIKTFVTVKNSVFKDAGIFAIGLDTHFAGPALETGSFFPDWKDLAKTSYGVKLKFEGDVKMYCWTDLSKVDSSTLIENAASLMPDLAFDINYMVEKISSNPEFVNIIYNHIGAKYVHAGIAFFGGGKNYSVFEGKYYPSTNDTSTKDFEIFNGYEISLEDVDRGTLQLAAGTESFFFLINDATNKNFLPSHQEEILSSGNPYSVVYQK